MPKRSAILDRRLKSELLGIVPLKPDEISEHALWKRAERLGLGSIKTMRRWLHELEQLGKVKSTEKGPYRSGRIPRFRMWQRRGEEETERQWGAWPLAQSDAEKLLKTLKTMTPYGIGSSGDLKKVSLDDCDPLDPIIFSNIPLSEMQEEVLEAWRNPESAHSWDFAYLLLEAWNKHLKKKTTPDEIATIEPCFLLLSFPREVYLWLLQRSFKEDMKEGEWKLRHLLKSVEPEEIPALRNYKTELRKAIRICEKGEYWLPSPTLLSVPHYMVPRQLAEFYRMQLSVTEQFLAEQSKIKTRTSKLGKAIPNHIG